MESDLDTLNRMHLYRQRLMSYDFYEEGKKILIVAHGLAIKALLGDGVSQDPARNKYHGMNLIGTFKGILNCIMIPLFIDFKTKAFYHTQNFYSGHSAHGTSQVVP